MKNLYQSLGVPKTATASEIKRAFRKLTNDHHPDKNPGDDAAEERFKEVSQAYDVLSDETRRRNYDEFGEISLTQGFDPERARSYSRGRSQSGFGSGFGSGGIDFGNVGDARAASFDDLLSKLFGGSRVQDSAGSPFGSAASAGPRKGRDIDGELTISLKDSLMGVTVPLRVSSDDPANTRTLDVKIPAGVSDGGRLRLRGQGGAGSPRGDIILTIRVQPGRRLTRDGDHLRLTLPVTAWEAYTGASVDVPTPWGEVSVKLPAGSQSGQVLRLRGKGVRKAKGDDGDLYIALEVVLPAPGDDELQAALERLQKAANPRESLGELV